MSKTLFVLLFVTWGLILLTQVLALVSGATDARAVWAMIAIVVALAGATITVVLKRRAGEK
ncbi:hypothetical protein [Microlunatus sp. GCM10028923]|uniref:hypothetical protein n=1 Tax=Microlunatus sp. GCM10028923 TaxID=3273400 RepID=UPI0036201598